MKIIKINDTKYFIPESYDDILLEDFENWFDYNPETTEDKIRLVSMICKIPFDILLELPTTVYTIIVDTISFCFSKSFNDYKGKNEITINGIRYSINHKEELTLAEWVDIEYTYNQDKDKLSEMLAIVCRPDGEKYNPKNNPERTQLFKKQPLEKLFPLFGFFLTLNQRLQTVILHCSTVQAMAGYIVEQSEDYIKNGDGTQQFAIWQRMIYRKLIKSLKKQLLKFSHS